MADSSPLAKAAAGAHRICGGVGRRDCHPDQAKHRRYNRRDTYLPSPDSLVGARGCFWRAREIGANRLELFTAESGIRGLRSTATPRGGFAKHFGLQRRVLPREDARAEDLEEWMFRIGYSIGEVRGWQSATMYKRLAGGHAMLEGNIGEVGRSYQWWVPGKDAYGIHITPQRLIELCNCTPDEELLARARALVRVGSDCKRAPSPRFVLHRAALTGVGLGSFPYALCDPRISHFSYVPSRYCSNACSRYLCPIAVPGTCRATSLRREWPALLEWPINKPIGRGHGCSSDSRE